MNVFALDDDPAAAARSLCDQHIPDAPRTSFAQAMPEQYRGDDAVVAYRRYYAAEKMILRGKPVTWTRRERPAWLPEVRS